MITYWIAVILGLMVVSSVQTARAVPPPDFIFAVGNQIVQVFSLLVLGFSVVAGVLRRFLQAHPFYVRHAKLIWLAAGIFVVGASFAGAYYYNQFRQNREYAQWVQQSKQQDSAAPAGQTGDNLDQLKIGGQAGQVLLREQALTDKGLAFIFNYYDNLGAGRIEQAYAVSSKIVSLPVYRGWYKDTTAVTVDNAQKIDDATYSLGLTLKEKNSDTRYGVLMHLKKQNSSSTALVIERSDVRVLSQSGSAQTLAEANPSGDFYSSHKNLDIKISNADFQAEAKSQVYVLDAREDEEYDIGRYPDSHHIRFADLKSGGWIGLPQDRVIYVMCWSGIRGKEVAEFLRTKQLVTRYLETGADGWVNFGGAWDGGITFSTRYSDQQYKIVFSTDEVKKRQQAGAILVDSRQPAKYQTKHIPGSINIPTIYTPTSEIDKAYSQVPPRSTVITICDDFVSCFDAKVTGVKLEKLGHIFLGRYNKPWEY